MNSSENKKTILIADDDIDLLAQTELLLKNAGYNVIAVEGQDDAERILQTVKPDMVITDLMMEAIDGGFSLAHYIKKKYPKCPVIIATGVTQETGMKFSVNTEEERSFIKADKILNKPVKHEVLLAEVERFLTEEI